MVYSEQQSYQEGDENFEELSIEAELSLLKKELYKSKQQIEAVRRLSNERIWALEKEVEYTKSVTMLIINQLDFNYPEDNIKQQAQELYLRMHSKVNGKIDKIIT